MVERAARGGDRRDRLRLGDAGYGIDDAFVRRILDIEGRALALDERAIDVACVVQNASP
ncbi:imidazoleglycerol phosphate dehydratase HisB [Novosphingobium chloroacetimidivorans]|uniref:Imidazoleglycerol phosphate dehydratase HisB n=1 Tax=Novosphingobium chloroacetimidivorans TaxID=1428314 RepID=A0A7W7K7F7_9SPHN|nr:imidazoleglycerol phosphate dehydratase HisB [Novosphingobium chloroacetimidivorans]